MASIRVLSGHGRYTDPWHPFAEGSAAIREILEAVGHRVEVRDDDVSCLQELDALDLVCLLYTSPSPRDQRGSRMPSSA